MVTLQIIHNKPGVRDWQNYMGDFVSYLQKRGRSVETFYWKDVDPAWAKSSVKDPEYPVFSWMMEPVGRIKSRSIPWWAYNSPPSCNLIQRDVVYPIWKTNGINCPHPVLKVPYTEAKSLVKYPVIAKRLGQMGKASLIKDEDALWWAYHESSWFGDNEWALIPYVDTAYGDGYFRLHRYFVCGDAVIPAEFSMTKSWVCKGSKMRRSADWPKEIKDRFIKEGVEFWKSSPKKEVLRAVKLLKLDIAAVDVSILSNGELMFWEANQYVCMYPDNIGAERRWMGMLEAFLYNEPFKEEDVSDVTLEEEFRRYLMEDWKSPKVYWRNKISAGDR